MKGISRRKFMRVAAQITTAAGITRFSPASLAASHALAAVGDARPNVLFIAIDDMSTNISAFGYPSVKTPHMEALAQRGVAFDHAYCQFPLCNPSRTSVMTGLRPENSGVLTNDVYWRDRIPHALDLPQHFANHGYDTVAVGKIFHMMQRKNRGAGWTRVIDTRGPSDGKWGRGHELDGALRDAIRSGRRPPPMAEFYQWGPSGLDGEDMMDGRFAAAASRFLGESHSKPFFLAVGFHNPHLPFAAPDRFFEMYRPESVPVPEVPPDNAKELPPFVRNAIPRNLAGRKITPELTRTLNRAYRACCSHVDACIGQVLDALKKNDLEKDTIVALWSDHGFLLGEYGMWGKNCLFEEACRVPLIIAAPNGNYVKGRRCDALVELVDLFPTLSELCALPIPEQLDGISLVPLLKNPKQSWKKTAFSVAKRDDIMGRSVRTTHWRYTEYTDGSAEFYDCRGHRASSHNQVRNDKHRKIVAQLQTLLRGSTRAKKR
jgi:uncharacterized sulfatase